MEGLVEQSWWEVTSINKLHAYNKKDLQQQFTFPQSKPAHLHIVFAGRVLAAMNIMIRNLTVFKGG